MSPPCRELRLTKLGSGGEARFHDLAQFGEPAPGRPRASPKTRAEAAAEVARGCEKPSSRREARQLGARLEQALQRARAGAGGSGSDGGVKPVHAWKTRARWNGEECTAAASSPSETGSPARSARRSSRPRRAAGGRASCSAWRRAAVGVEAVRADRPRDQRVQRLLDEQEVRAAPPRAGDATIRCWSEVGVGSLAACEAGRRAARELLQQRRARR